MSDEFPKPSGDCTTDRMRQRKAEAQRQAHSSARATRWDVTGYYSCNKCGWKGERPHNHDKRCIEAVFVKPMPTARLVGCATFAEEWNHRVDLGLEMKRLNENKNAQNIKRRLGAAGDLALAVAFLRGFLPSPNDALCDGGPQSVESK